MSVTVRVPPVFRPLTSGESTVSVEGATVAQVLASLDAAYPGFSEKLLSDDGSPCVTSMCLSTTTMSALWKASTRSCPMASRFRSCRLWPAGPESPSHFPVLAGILSSQVAIQA